MKKIRVAAAFVTLIMAFSIVSCTNKNSSSASSSKTDSSSTAVQKTKMYKISCDDYSTTVWTISGLSRWATKKHTRNDFDTVYAYSYAPLFYCCFYVYPEKNAQNLIEKHKSQGYKTGTAQFQDKTVTYSVNYLLPEEKLIDRITLHLPIGNGYVKEVGISVSGTVYHDASDTDGQSIKDWVIKHKDKYAELSDDPNDYLYLFAAFVD